MGPDRETRGVGDLFRADSALVLPDRCLAASNLRCAEADKRSGTDSVLLTTELGLACLDLVPDGALSLSGTDSKLALVTTGVMGLDSIFVLVKCDLPDAIDSSDRDSFP